MKKQLKETGLNGSWRAVYSEVEGEMTSVAHFSTIIITYKNGNFKIESDGKVKHEGTYKIKNSGSIPKIVYTYTKSSFYSKGEPRTGIVQLTGDTLKDCLGGIGDPAPRTFNTTKGSNTVMTIHRRVGKEGGSRIRISQSGDISEW